MRKTSSASAKPRCAARNRCPVTPPLRLLRTAFCCWRRYAPLAREEPLTTRHIPNGENRSPNDLRFSISSPCCAATAAKLHFRLLLRHPPSPFLTISHKTSSSLPTPDTKDVQTPAPRLQSGELQFQLTQRARQYYTRPS